MIQYQSQSSRVIWVCPIRSDKSERRHTKDKNKTTHKTIQCLEAKLNQRWHLESCLVGATCLSYLQNWDARSIPYLYLQKPERSTLIQKGPGTQNHKGPGDISLGTLPVLFLHVHIDCLQVLTDPGSIYRRIFKTERHKWSLHTENLLLTERSTGQGFCWAWGIWDEPPNVMPRSQSPPKTN